MYLLFMSRLGGPQQTRSRYRKVNITPHHTAPHHTTDPAITETIIMVTCVKNSSVSVDARMLASVLFCSYDDSKSFTVSFNTQETKPTKALRALPCQCNVVTAIRVKGKLVCIQSIALLKAHTHHPWQTFLFRHKLNFSGKHSAMLQLLREYYSFTYSHHCLWPGTHFYS